MSRIINRVRGIRGSFRPGQVITTPTRGTRGPAQLSDINTLASQLGAAGVGSGAAGNGVPSGGSDGQVLAKVAGAVAWTFTTAITAVGTIVTGVWHGTKIALAYGGTNADLSATGGSGQVLKQDSAGGNVTVGLVTILGTIATGVWQGTKIALGYGGTNADLSATGGAGKVLKQTSAGAAITVAQVDYSELAGTQPVNAITALTGDVTASGTGSQAATLATVNSNVGTFGDGTHVAQVTVNGKGLITAASNVAITGGGGSGTVTSVSMTVPAELSVSGSPITTSGTLAVTWANQADNKILANISGGSAAPSFSTVTAVLDHALGSTNDKFAIRRSGSWTQDQISALLTAGTGISLSGTTNVTVSGNYTAGAGISISGATITNTGASGTPGGSGDYIAPVYAGGPPEIMRAWGEHTIDGGPGTGPAGSGAVGCPTIHWNTPKQKGNFITWDGARFVSSQIINLNAAKPDRSFVAGGWNAVLHMISNDTLECDVFWDSYGTGNASTINLRAARGTGAAPTATQASDIIGQVGGWGYGATGFSASPKGILRITANENWTDAAQGTYFTFRATPNGSITNAEVARLHNSGCWFLGTTTNDNAAAGVIGEVVSSNVLTGSAVSLVSATAKDITTISLTAGDWEVSGVVAFKPAGTTTITQQIAAINTATNTLPTLDPATPLEQQSGSAVAGVGSIMGTGTARVSLSATTTYRLIAQSTFATSTMAAYGYIYARRMR
jgi:hypothetical protein